ncbi:MED7 protein-domain-containing protein [Geopyxis carbonaria]|nr:MED7 protein-domain-containing protein [Geopyxis carbonaria]
MAEPTSAFPDPPPFYKHFTPENLTAHKSRTATSTPLPPDSPLSYLTPPPLPPSGSYRTFGEHWTFPARHPTLEENGIPRLYDASAASPSSPTRMIELRRLTKSMLLSYLELVGVLGFAPGEFGAKTKDIQDILYNIHHLINQYRPHQARETLCLLMEAQLERTRRQTERDRAAVRAVEEALLEVAAGAERIREEERREKEEEEARRKVESPEERARRRDAQAWADINEAFKSG